LFQRGCGQTGEPRRIETRETIGIIPDRADRADRQDRGDVGRGLDVWEVAHRRRSCGLGGGTGFDPIGACPTEKESRRQGPRNLLHRKPKPAPPDRQSQRGTVRRIPALYTQTDWRPRLGETSIPLGSHRLRHYLVENLHCLQIDMDTSPLNYRLHLPLHQILALLYRIPTLAL